MFVALCMVHGQARCSLPGHTLLASTELPKRGKSPAHLAEQGAAFATAQAACPALTTVLGWPRCVLPSCRQCCWQCRLPACHWACICASS